MSDYDQRRKQLIDALTPEERKVFDEAYAAASLTTDLAGEAHQEALALADADRGGGDMDFVEAISDIAGDE